MIFNKLNFTCSVVLAFIINSSANAQNEPIGSDGKQINSIQTAMPFLSIGPDARSGAMGDVGVAISPDANSIHWNPSKLAFMEKPVGFSFSYTPWVRNIIKDVDLTYLSGYYRLDERNTVGASLRYFSLGTIIFTQDGKNETPYSPNEFAFDATFSRKFGEDFSLGTAVRYIRSSLANGVILANGATVEPASALAADISGYYKKGTMMFGKNADLALGFNISNIGTKVKYSNSDASPKSFLPTNMKLGAATTLNVDDLSKFTVALDINKLLVPTSPLSDSSVPSAIFGSFSDAPGGFSEEMREISYALGTEYLYNQQFALRAGFFYEDPTKGNRQYFTLGAGLRYNVFNLDLAYLLASQQKSPLANTLRFTLAFNFAKK